MSEWPSVPTPFYLGKSGHVGGLEVTRYSYLYNGEGKDKRGPECRLASPDILLTFLGKDLQSTFI